MTLLFFLIRYAPFWGISLIFLLVELGITFSVKGKNKVGRVCFLFCVPIIILLVFYFWAGGPEKSVAFAAKYIRMATAE